MKILTGIDLPFEPSCGSMILSDDIYSSLPDGVEARFLSLKGEKQSKEWTKMKDVVLFDIEKVYDENKYTEYVNKLYNAIEEQIEEYNPDLIHIQHLSFGMALAFSRFQKLPKISLCHGTDVLFSINNDFHKRNVKLVCDSSDYVVFPTNEVYKDLKRIVGIELGLKAKIINWGIPKVRSNLSIKACDPDDIKLLYAGRISENKGVDVVVDSLERLPKNFSLTIIGSGPYEGRVKDLVIKKSLRDRVTYIPFMPRTDLWKTFSKYDAMIVPTKEVESFCLIAIEAQAHNLPIIYSNTSGLREVLGKSGIMFEPRNPEDLSRKIQEFFKSSDYIKIVEKGKKNARNYSITETINKLMKYSKELV